jgi:hypothetical protein
MTERYTNIEDIEARIAELNELLGFPDNTGTLTYAEPVLTEDTDEDGNVTDTYYLLSITSEVMNLLYPKEDEEVDGGIE